MPALVDGQRRAGCDQRARSMRVICSHEEPNYRYGVGPKSGRFGHPTQTGFAGRFGRPCLGQMNCTRPQSAIALEWLGRFFPHLRSRGGATMSAAVVGWRARQSVEVVRGAVASQLGEEIGTPAGATECTPPARKFDVRYRFCNKRGSQSILEHRPLTRLATRYELPWSTPICTSMPAFFANSLTRRICRLRALVIPKDNAGKRTRLKLGILHRRICQWCEPQYRGKHTAITAWSKDEIDCANACWSGRRAGALTPNS